MKLNPCEKKFTLTESDVAASQVTSQSYVEPLESSLDCEVGDLISPVTVIFDEEVRDVKEEEDEEEVSLGGLQRLRVETEADSKAA